MYYEYFGFRYPPFKITPDTSLFFPGGNRGAILEALSYAIRNGEGIVKVVGEVGSGKTMLCRMLEIELPKNIEIVYLANPRLSPDNILQAIAFELKLPVTDEDNRLLVMQALQNYLLERHAQDRQVVVFVEEAQSMPMATLEEIRLLSNLETNQHKLLQIVLFGQPELDEMLARPQIRQLKERITYSFQLEPLRSSEIRDYLNARLRSCGYRGGSLFTPGAIGLIARHSQGLLRRVNILADKALLAAYAANVRRVGRRQVRAAVRDSGFAPLWRSYLWPAAAALLLLAAVLVLYPRLGGDGTGWGWPAASGISATETAQPISADSREQAPAPATHVPAEPLVPAEAIEDLMEPSIEMMGGPAEPPAAAEAQSRPATEQRRPAMHEDPLEDSNVWAAELDGSSSAIGPSREEPAWTRMVPVPANESRGGDSAAGGMETTRLLMREHLQRLPPEEVWLDAPATPDTTCRRCIAIIYRPLQGTEKM